MSASWLGRADVELLIGMAVNLLFVVRNQVIDFVGELGEILGVELDAVVFHVGQALG